MSWRPHYWSRYADPAEAISLRDSRFQKLNSDSMTSTTTDHLPEYDDLLVAFQSAVDLTSDLIPVEDCPDEELAPVLHISQVMLNRAQEQTRASIELFLSGHWAAFEALSRISLEYSIQFSALMNSDPRKTLGQYLGDHFLDMERRQKQMRDVLIASSDAHRLRELDGAQRQMLARRQLVSGYADFCGFSLTQNKQKSRAFDYFNSLGKAHLYRGLYSVLSSQVHADAESLIDYIVNHCVLRTEEERGIAAQELHHWMAHFLVKIVGAYVEACEGLARCFSFEDISQHLEKISLRVAAIDSRYSAHFKQFKANALS